jgi:hypothetical protein
MSGIPIALPRAAATSGIVRSRSPWSSCTTWPVQSSSIKWRAATSPMSRLAIWITFRSGRKARLSVPVARIPGIAPTRFSKK